MVSGAAPPALLHAALDGWMRHEAASAHARLIRRFGWDRAGLAEDALQEALVRALETWPFKGVPDQPGAWLYVVAGNRMLDAIRSAAERRSVPLDDAPQVGFVAEGPAVVDRDALSDPELAVLFALCHPALDTPSAIAVALQILCGFTLREIASALLIKPDAVAQRVSRAKATLRGVPGIADTPTGEPLRQRLAVALDVVALIFNEGFEPSSGDRPARADLCAEALRLADALAHHPVTRGPETHALAALLNLLFARLPARLANPGAVTLLPEQDRSVWSREHLRRGLRHLAASAGGDRISRYHLLAGIAASHAAAPSIEATDWDAIVADYRRLVNLEDSPVHRLNLAVALQRAGEGVLAAAEIKRLLPLPQMRGYFWFHVARSEIAGQLEDHHQSRAALADALALAKTAAQDRFVREKLDGAVRCPRSPG